MKILKLTNADTQSAEAIWARYEQAHDVAHLKGKTAGVDPQSERIWIGESIEDVVDQMRADGLSAPLYFVRIGYDSYFRKGGHR